MRVVVNEVCSNNDDGLRGGGRCLGCVPTVLGGDWNPGGKRYRPEYRDPEKRDGGGTSSRMVRVKRDAVVRRSCVWCEKRLLFYNLPGGVSIELWWCCPIRYKVYK